MDEFKRFRDSLHHKDYSTPKMGEYYGYNDHDLLKAWEVSKQYRPCVCVVSDDGIVESVCAAHDVWLMGRIKAIKKGGNDGNRWPFVQDENPLA